MQIDSNPTPNTFLIVLSAPSGTGKSTLIRLLCERYLNIKHSVSTTTRKPRGAEQDGVDYYFISEDAFQKNIQHQAFVEYALVFGKTWYGTLRAPLEESLNTGTHLILDLDVQGAAALKKIYGSRAITIFIAPPSEEELQNRLMKRKTESAEAIAIRLETARQELKQASSFDHIVVNYKLEEAFSQIVDILTKHSCQLQPKQIRP